MKNGQMKVTMPPDAKVNHTVTMEQHFFRVFSALLAVLFLLVWAPMNLFLRHNLRFTATSLMFGTCFLTFSVLARRKNLYLFRLYCVTHLIMTNVQWYLSGGSLGRQELVFFSLAFSAILFLRGTTQLIFLIATILNGLVLYGVEMVAPGCAIGYSSTTQRLQDHAIAFVIIMLGCAWAVRFIVRAYEAEHEELSRAHGELQNAMGELRILRGFLSTCAWCKKVREDSGKWVPMEDYIQAHTHALFTHGACPECAKLLLEEGHAPTADTNR
jgi:hypothetical protein